MSIEEDLDTDLELELETLSKKKLETLAEKIHQIEMALSSETYRRDRIDAEKLFEKHKDILKPIKVTIPVEFTISIGSSNQSARVEISEKDTLYDIIYQMPDVKNWADNVYSFYKSLSKKEINALSSYTWSNFRKWYASNDGEIENNVVPNMYYKNILK